MTKERAILILSMNEQARWRNGITPEEDKEAVDMAIEAFKSNESENDLNGLWGSLGKCLGEILKEMSSWMQAQMVRNNLLQHQIYDLKDRINELEKRGGDS